MIKVLFINNDGGGFADYVEIEAGTTVNAFFRDKIGGDASPADYTIRVNRQPIASSQELVEGDRVTFTPTKIDGNIVG